MAQQQPMVDSKEKTYSTYYRELDDEAKVRYREKLAMLGHVDDSQSADWQQWPEVEYPDIFKYPVTTPSLYMQDQLKAYKSLDAYNFLVIGWVSNVSVFSLVSCPGTFLALAHVKHSQRISAAPQALDCMQWRKLELCCVLTVPAWQDLEKLVLTLLHSSSHSRLTHK